MRTRDRYRLTDKSYYNFKIRGLRSSVTNRNSNVRCKKIKIYSRFEPKVNDISVYGCFNWKLLFLYGIGRNYGSYFNFVSSHDGCGKSVIGVLNSNR